MEYATIAEISIDEAGRLRVKPESAEFPLIYRAAAEIGWDSTGAFLFSPPPREWSYVQWFEKLVAAVADEYGCKLDMSSRTRWHGVPTHVREAIEKQS